MTLFYHVVPVVLVLTFSWVLALVVAIADLITGNDPVDGMWLIATMFVFQIIWNAYSLTLLLN